MKFIHTCKRCNEVFSTKGRTCPKCGYWYPTYSVIYPKQARQGKSKEIYNDDSSRTYYDNGRRYDKHGNCINQIQEF